MEDLDQIIEEIKENTYDNELADIYIRAVSYTHLRAHET